MPAASLVLGLIKAVKLGTFTVPFVTVTPIAELGMLQLDAAPPIVRKQIFVLFFLIVEIKITYC